MFKMMVLFALLAVVAARPGLLGAEASLETIGTIVNSIPTSISHQSQTQIHSQPIVTSIVQEAEPILSSPLLSSQIISSPLLEEQGQILAGHGSVIGQEASLFNEQAAIIGQDSLIGEEGLLLGGHAALIENGASIIGNQAALVGNSGLLAESIASSGLELNGLHH